MKTLILLFLTFLTTPLFADEIINLDFKFKRGYDDDFMIRHMGGGKFMVIAIKEIYHTTPIRPGFHTSNNALNGWYTYKTYGASYDKNGNKLDDLKNYKLSLFAEKKENAIYYSNGSSALNTSLTKYQYDSNSGKLYQFETANRYFAVNEILVNGYVESFRLANNDKILGGSKLISWDIFKVSDSCYSSFLTYNNSDKTRLNLVQVDYNKRKNEFKIVNNLWINELKELNGHDRPKFKIVKIDNEAIFFYIYANTKDLDGLIRTVRYFGKMDKSLNLISLDEKKSFEDEFYWENLFYEQVFPRSFKYNDLIYSISADYKNKTMKLSKSKTLSY